LAHPLTNDLELLARPVAEAVDLSVQSVEVLMHRIPITVLVKVQRADGGDVSLDECAALSAPLAESFDTSGLLEMAYVLEVSSPGIGETLESDRDFTSFRGFPVLVQRRGTDGSEVSLSGHLLARDDQVLQLNDHGRILRIPRQEVLWVRLADAPPDP
jgi:ribosome maturation factor RimP